MEIFNGHSTSQSPATCGSGSRLPGPLGQRGPPGIGFTLTQYGNYDLENKKLTNVKNGDDDLEYHNKLRLYIPNLKNMTQ